MSAYDCSACASSKNLQTPPMAAINLGARSAPPRVNPVTVSAGAWRMLCELFSGGRVAQPPLPPADTDYENQKNEAASEAPPNPYSHPLINGAVGNRTPVSDQSVWRLYERVWRFDLGQGVRRHRHTPRPSPQSCLIRVPGGSTRGPARSFSIPALSGVRRGSCGPKLGRESVIVISN